MHEKNRKFEACYRSNMDYNATYARAGSDARVLSLSQTEKGHIYMKFKGLERVLTLISTQGTVQVFYSTLNELHACQRFLGEVLVPKSGEVLYLEPQDTYDLLDKIRRLIQEDKITHDMNLDLGKLAELTGWEREEIRESLPAISQELFPHGIELKVSRIVAGCSRAELYVEEWLRNVEQALKREGFYSPFSFEWDQNQSFELVRHLYAGVNYEAVVRVKAFLDGRIITEAKPQRLTDLADRSLNDILDKYQIPYEKKVPVKKATPLLPIALLGIAALGVLALYEISR